MVFNYTTNLWPNTEERFFDKITIKHIRQSGPTCVATVLAMLTNKKPEDFIDKINTQNPVSWSLALSEYGMKLAYCPTDVRKLKFYMDELISLNDLFLLCYYTPNDGSDILKDPDEKGWICGSHVVILHKDKIFDPNANREKITDAKNHPCNNKHTKRIFRVVPADYPRGL